MQQVAHIQRLFFTSFARREKALPNANNAFPDLHFSPITKQNLATVAFHIQQQHKRLSLEHSRDILSIYRPLLIDVFMSITRFYNEHHDEPMEKETITLLSAMKQVTEHGNEVVQREMLLHVVRIFNFEERYVAIRGDIEVQVTLFRATKYLAPQITEPLNDVLPALETIHMKLDHVPERGEEIIMVVQDVKWLVRVVCLLDMSCYEGVVDVDVRCRRWPMV